MRHEIEQRLLSNLERVRNLVTLYENQLSGPGRGRRPVSATDVLRAATVLLHSAFEDFLRSLGRYLLPLSEDPEFLAKIPLDQSDSRATKFSFASLAPYRTRSVRAILTQSINSYLNDKSYGNLRAVRDLLRSMGIADCDFENYQAGIAELMDRRHHIVHQADRNDQPGQGHHATRAINAGHLHRWLAAVEATTDAILRSVDDAYE